MILSNKVSRFGRCRSTGHSLLVSSAVSRQPSHDEYDKGWLNRDFFLRGKSGGDRAPAVKTGLRIKARRRWGDHEILESWRAACIDIFRTGRLPVIPAATVVITLVLPRV